MKFNVLPRAVEDFICQISKKAKDISISNESEKRNWLLALVFTAVKR